VPIANGAFVAAGHLALGPERYDYPPNFKKSQFLPFIKRAERF
jgi:hypothetical protein